MTVAWVIFGTCLSLAVSAKPRPGEDFTNTCFFIGGLWPVVLLFAIVTTWLYRRQRLQS